MLDTVFNLQLNEIFCIVLFSFGLCALVAFTDSFLYYHYVDREGKENRRIRRLIEKQKLKPPMFKRAVLGQN